MDLSLFSMEGKTAIVTGGSGGIGRGCARAFAKAGANVVIASVPPQDIPAALAEVEALGAQAIGVTVDVSNAQQVANMVKQAVDRFGGIDVLVNVAGGSYSRNDYTPQFTRGPLLDVDEGDFMGAYEVNVKGTFLCSRAVVPVMRQRGKGAIINIGSSIVRGASSPELAAYASAKAAVMNLTVNMAHQWGPEVRVNCIAPGVINTLRPGTNEPISAAYATETAVGRIGTADDIGPVALFLASDAAAFVNGSVIEAHGGV